MSYLNKDLDITKISQTERADKRQIQNSEKGYVFKPSDFDNLKRFLIIGSEGGTYYASKRKTTEKNLNFVKQCIKIDGVKTVEIIREISKSGRAVKNDPALLALALASIQGDRKTKSAAYDSLPEVARIGTHLYQFVEFRNLLGSEGWGTGMRRAVASIYTEKDEHVLALHAVKYKQRGGWSNKDMLKLSHPVAKSVTRNAIYKWILKETITDHTPEFLVAASKLKIEKNKKAAVKLIIDHKLPHEAVPTWLKKEPEIWDALLNDMPIRAMIFNLANMTKYGLLVNMSDATKKVIKAISDEKKVKYSRIHPINVLASTTAYHKGHSSKTKEKWTPVASILTALEGTFYAAFKGVEPTDKNTMLAIDCSGSMSSSSIGIEDLSNRTIAAVMAMVTAKAENPANCLFTGFTAAGRRWNSSTGITELDINKNMLLREVIKKIDRVDWGSTDCSLPMKYALENKLPIETFVVYTDNETYAGSIHPHIALRNFRKKMNIPAKLIVVATASNGFTIADPSDTGMLDIVGFDSAAPQLISTFAKEGI
jgi:60 kDa SS-A/Ro ribonucleoprotein